MPSPILYSFRRCPYAMRARLALRIANIDVEHREILLKNKPAHMLEVSPKGTVPVLILPGNEVIDESLDIALWALKQTDHHNLLWNENSQLDQDQLKLIKQNDSEFKYWLDRYKYHVGYPEQPVTYYREQAETFLTVLEEKLGTQNSLFGDQPSLADIAIFPFVRQFAFVNKDWFDKTPYEKVQSWLETWISSPLFEQVMTKHPEWRNDGMH